LSRVAHVVRKGYEKGLITIDEYGLVDCPDEFFDDYTRAYKETATNP